MPITDDVRKYGETVLEQGKRRSRRPASPGTRRWAPATLAYEQAARTQLSQLPAEVQDRLRKLRTKRPSNRRREAVGKTADQSAAGTYAAQAKETYETLAHPGELVVRRLRRSPEVHEAFDKAESLVADTGKNVEQAEDTVTKPGPQKPAPSPHRARRRRRPRHAHHGPSAAPHPHPEPRPRPGAAAVRHPPRRTARPPGRRMRPASGRWPPGGRAPLRAAPPGHRPPRRPYPWGRPHTAVPSLPRGAARLTRPVPPSPRAAARLGVPGRPVSWGGPFDSGYRAFREIQGRTPSAYKTCRRAVTLERCSG